MGNYLGVNAVKEKGNKIISMVPNEQPTIPTGKFLVMILCNGLWALAPEVTDPEEYQVFYDGYSQGHYLSFTVYAVPESERDNCKDEGRQPC